MTEVLETEQIIASSSMWDAQNRVNSVESGLKGANPILQVHTGIIDAFAHAYKGIDLRELPLIKRTFLPVTSYYELNNLNLISIQLEICPTCI